MTHLSVIRVVNEYRNNRVTVDFIPKDGSTGAELADTCSSLYRADEQDSGAQEAYDNAFEEAVGGGFGAWRVLAGYDDDDDDENDRQRVRFEPIFDADSCVYFDLDAKRQDKSDARRCFVLVGMSHDAFKDQFGEDPTTWPKDTLSTEFDWCTPETVYIAHYYVVEEVAEVVHIFRGLDGQERRVSAEDYADDDLMKTLRVTGFREVRQKRVKRKKVHKYILSGAKVEEDEGYIAGRCIPVVPVYGKRQYVDGIERCMGHVRLAKDAQRLFNTLMSWLTDIAGRFDIEKPILTPEQVLGHATRWARDNVDRYPYLLVNALKDDNGQTLATQPIGYTKAPSVPPAMAALVQLAQQALQDLLGNQQAGEEMKPQISGRAVELIQNRLDMQVFIYTSNFAKAMKRCGEIWLSMSKDLLVENDRTMKTVATDGQVGSVVMNTQGTYDPDTGDVDEQANSLTAATFDVWADVGPSSSNQRAATVRALTGIASITDDPQTKQALTLATIANLEGEGLGDLRDWARKQAVQIGIMKPTDEEKQEMAAAQQAAAGQPPDAQTQFLLAQAEESMATATKAKASTVQVLADANLKQAQADELRASTAGQHPDQQIASAQALHDMLTTAATPPAGG